MGAIRDTMLVNSSGLRAEGCNSGAVALPDEIGKRVATRYSTWWLY